MKIRQLYAYELRPAAALVMETYSRMEQPYVANPKEIEDFKRYADEDHLWVESCKNKLFYLERLMIMTRCAPSVRSMRRVRSRFSTQG